MRPYQWVSTAQKVTRFTCLTFSALFFGLPSAFAEIEEIVVTARGQEQSVRDIPVAITVMNEKTMQDLNLTSFEEVGAMTPSLNVIRGTSGNGAALYVRGMGPSTTSIGIEQSVAVILDGVYYPQGRVINEGLFDVRQVAIMKGPQALYFGKNATAGVMAIMSNNPTEEFEIQASVSYEYEEKQTATELIISGPLTDSIGARLAIRNLENDGYMTNAAGPTIYNTLDSATFVATPQQNNAPRSSTWPDTDSFYARLTLAGDLNDTFSWNVKASYTDFEIASTNGGVELWNCPTLNGLPHINDTTDPRGYRENLESECRKDYTRDNNPVPPTIAATNPLLSTFGGELGERYESWAITGTFDWTFERFDLTAIINYHDQETDWVSDFDGGGATAVFAGENGTFDNFSAELRTVTRFDGAVNFVGGVYYQETERFFDQDVIFAGAENSLAPDPTERFTAYSKLSETDGETISVYGEVIWGFAERWEFTVGLRWLEETKDSFFLQPYVNPFFVGLFTPFDPTDPSTIIASDQKFTETIPEVTLRWEPTDSMTTWVAYKEGFKSGGFSNSGILGNISGSVSDFVFEPEEVDGFEAGIKGSLFDNSLTYEVEIYFYDFKNLQVDFFNSAQFAFITSNAGAATTEGAEVQIRWAPNVEGLTLMGGLAFNQAEYDDFINPCHAGQTPAQGCTIDLTTPGTVPKTQLGGTDRPLAPKWSGFVGVDYERGLSNGMTLGLTLNIQYKDDFLVGQNPINTQDGYTTIDAAIRLGGGTKHRWQLALIGKNLSDEYALLSSGDNPSSGGGAGTDTGWFGDQAGNTIRPQTVEIKATYWFGG